MGLQIGDIVLLRLFLEKEVVSIKKTKIGGFC